MNQENKLSCPDYPECGCNLPCSKVSDNMSESYPSIAKKDMFKRLKDPDTFEVIKPDTGCHSNAWHKDPEIDVVALGPVTVKDKQILEESDWTPRVDYDPKSVQIDSSSMKQILDIYKQMQKEDQEAQELAEKSKAEEKKKAETKSVLVIHCNIVSFKENFQEGGLESYMTKISDKFKKVLPSTVAVLTLPICNGQDRIELMHLS